MFPLHTQSFLRTGLLLLSVLSVFSFSPVPVLAREYTQIVVISDLHYPTKTRKKALRQEKIRNKEAALADINQWPDVDLCVLTGDMVQRTGERLDERVVRNFLDGLHHPVSFLAGNHEIMYEGLPTLPGTLRKGDAGTRFAHLMEYQWNFGSLYHSQDLAGYHLVFLSPDCMTSPYAVELSPNQLSWLQQDLAAHRHQPTLIFCHAPLTGTMLPGSKLDTPWNYTQPADPIRQLLVQNPQVILWVSGHTHTPPKSRNFISSLHWIPGTSTWNVYCPTWDGDQAWTQSLLLYPDRVIIRTYDHKKGQWMKKKEETVKVPQV